MRDVGTEVDSSSRGLEKKGRADSVAWCRNSVAWLSAQGASRRSKSLRRRVGVCLLGLLAVLSAGLSAGCQSVGYYTQAIKGQVDILARREPIEQLIDVPDTPSSLKARFRLVLELREFAKEELHLPIDRHYLSYVALDRPHVVWNVYACPQYSLEPKSWWYPFVGSLEYRGYFKERRARRHARRLKRQGYDVHVEGVDAYSTLGWFRDPLLSTFVDYPKPQLAATLFHELAHQKLFAAGDTDFNEAFATAVARRGVTLWLEQRASPKLLARYKRHLRRKDQVIKLLLDYRATLKTFYDSIEAGQNATTGKKQVSNGLAVDDIKAKKRALFSSLKRDYQRLKSEWNGYSGYDHWFEGPPNNAQLNSIATYHHLLPAFNNLLHAKSGRWHPFYKHARRWAKLKPERREQVLSEWASRTSGVSKGAAGTE